MPSQRHSLWSRLTEVGLPFYTRGPRRKAYGGLAALIALLLSVNGLNVVNSYVGRFFMSALGERDIQRFYLFAGLLAAVFGASTVVQVLATYVQQLLTLVWREWQTRYLLDRYLAGRAYRRLTSRPEVDNPDQRITDDVRTFTDSTMGFFVLLFNGVVTFLAFAGVLWSIRPGLLLAAVAYAALGSVGTILLGRRLVPLNNQQLKKEADFRFALGRVREHAEAVAQLAGERAERSRLGGRLDALISNFRTIIVVSRNLGFFTSMYNFLPQIIPVVLAAPLYMSGEVELGVVTQASMAFAQVLGALSLIITQFIALSAYAAVVERLGTLWEMTEPETAPRPAAPKVAAVKPAPLAAAGPSASPKQEGRCVAYEKLTLRNPREGRPLVQELSLEITEGKRVLVTGPSGSGKSALLLATAGLWKSGDGQIVRPEQGGVMFLPAVAYTPSGKLRDLLHYGVGQELDDERLWYALREVGLDQLVEMSGGLDAEQDWKDVLNPCEQQLVAFARLLAVVPRFAFLDDPGAALDDAAVQRVYEALYHSPITYVSVAGHFDLRKYHDLVLELRGDGSWQTRPALPPSAA